MPRRRPIPTAIRSRAGTTSARTNTARRSSRPTARPASTGSRRATRYLSKDGRSVFVGVPDMKPVMQMRVGWSLATAAGATFQESAYFTPYELRDVRSAGRRLWRPHRRSCRRGPSVAEQSAPVSVEEGRRLYQLYGCIACHSIESPSISKLGPTWKGLYGSERTLAKGGRAGDRRRGLPPGGDPRAGGEDRRPATSAASRACRATPAC